MTYCWEKHPDGGKGERALGARGAHGPGLPHGPVWKSMCEAGSRTCGAWGGQGPSPPHLRGSCGNEMRWLLGKRYPCCASPYPRGRVLATELSALPILPVFPSAGETSHLLPSSASNKPHFLNIRISAMRWEESPLARSLGKSCRSLQAVSVLPSIRPSVRPFILPKVAGQGRRLPRLAVGFFSEMSDECAWGLDDFSWPWWCQE